MKTGTGLVQKTITDSFFSSGSGVEGIYYPYSFHISPWMSWSSATNTPTREANTVPITLARLATANVNGSSVTWNVRLAAGTWTIGVTYSSAASHGIMAVQVDGVTKATVDCYAASGANNLVSTTTGIVVATSGYHTITLLTNGKNASSSAYTLRPSTISGARTGA